MTGAPRPSGNEYPWARWVSDLAMSEVKVRGRRVGHTQFSQRAHSFAPFSVHVLQGELTAELETALDRLASSFCRDWPVQRSRASLPEVSEDNGMGKAASPQEAGASAGPVLAAPGK